jgi:predicted nuclease with RNAse H fold
MLTVGVDLAAEPEKTAIAWLDWRPDRVLVRRIETRTGDELILEAVVGANKSAIDCPFGWPDRFVDFVTAHRVAHVDVPSGVAGRAWRRDLTLRVTDQVVHDFTGLTPLSVSADRIGHTAMRCASLLAKLAQRGQPVDRGGVGAVVEVYPAASLKRWDLLYRGYKRVRDVGHSELGRLIDKLQAMAPWLDLGDNEYVCRTFDDAADAVIAALTAGAALQGLVTVPGQEHVDTARTEGWIALPTTPLRDLCSQVALRASARRPR